MQCAHTHTYVYIYTYIYIYIYIYIYTHRYIYIDIPNFRQICRRTTLEREREMFVSCGIYAMGSNSSLECRREAYLEVSFFQMWCWPSLAGLSSSCRIRCLDGTRWHKNSDIHGCDFIELQRPATFCSRTFQIVRIIRLARLWRIEALGY